MTEQLPESIMLHGLPGEGARQTSVEESPHENARLPTTEQAQVTRLTYLGGGMLVPSETLVGTDRQNTEFALSPKEPIEASSGGLLRRLTRNIAETIIH